MIAGFVPGAAVLVISGERGHEGEIEAEQKIRSATPAGRVMRLEDGSEFALKWGSYRIVRGDSRIVLDTPKEREIAERRRVENAERAEAERARAADVALRRRLAGAIYSATAEQVAAVAAILEPKKEEAT